MKKQDNKFSSTAFAAAMQSAGSAGDHGRALARTVVAAVKGLRGDARLIRAAEVLSDLHQKVEKEIRSLGTGVTTDPVVKKFLNSFRVAARNEGRRHGLDIKAGIRGFSVSRYKPAKTETDSATTDSATDSATNDSATDSAELATEASRRDHLIRRIEAEASIFVGACTDAGIDELAARQEFLDAIEGWAEAARLAMEREAKATKATRKAKATSKAKAAKAKAA